ncbi:pleckstrin homology domain-containing family O member 2 [Kryptolebias marmoratus]|uniref:Pleckstrin homology domain containing, family O member 2 n=1 Tax=Kryptolebias marmoratus TaxID=37003 RepID=A0A3Q3FW89_KRYMA|nr:pleckstrin homology domain-containing family O member 2 [Kryptolebias marmoratus]
MEDGTKEDPAQQKKAKFLSKAGWLKKSHGKLLASYKDRYIHVEKTEVVVYENEDLQNCLERFDLEKYDKCHELKSPFKKKHRLILIRSPKSGNKVHDVKFQTQSAEEKETWIKAISDCINRAKNKVFDEVKIDESINLEHVTRTRPKGNRNRRPPTRIHMKEVADVSSDGVLRLDLDLEDAVMPNGTHRANTNDTDKPKEEKPLLTVIEEDAQTEPEATTQKKAIKPPMPPTKEAKSKPAPEDEPNKDDSAEKKVLKPPMPPSKEVKPCATPAEEAAEDQKASVKKKTGPPPTPPNKPSPSSSLGNHPEILPSTPNSQAPTPPSKEKKPSKTAAELEQQVQDTADEKKEKEEDSGNETTEPALETEEAEELSREKALPPVEGDQLESATAEERASDEETSDNDQQEPAAPQRKSPSPPLTSKKTPEKSVAPATQNKEDPSAVTQPDEARDSTASDTVPLQAPEAHPDSEVPSVVVSCNDPLSDSLGLLCHLSGEKKKAEEKSVDSGQHSDDESEGSGCEDTLATSTAALRGSNVGLDVLDASDDSDNIQVSVNLRPSAEPQVRPNVFPCRRSHPFQKPPKPLNKPKSASICDLLSESTKCTQMEAESTPALKDHVTKLETEVALEMDKTSELLSKAQGGSRGEDVPEDLLAKALEKLKKADHVLREVKKLKLTKNSMNRMSW